IYRDLRDVAVSEAHYLTRMNRWHRLHRVYRALPDDAARIAFAITGDIDRRLPVAYPDIAARFNRYKAWLCDPDVCAVRFEDLFGEAQHATIERIIAHYAKRIEHDFDVPAVVRAAIS